MRTYHRRAKLAYRERRGLSLPELLASMLILALILGQVANCSPVRSPPLSCALGGVADA